MNGININGVILRVNEDNMFILLIFVVVFSLIVFAVSVWDDLNLKKSYKETEALLKELIAMEKDKQ